MIIIRTPLRISLAGGGTDMSAFYKRQVGAVVSFAIDKYMYININKKFDKKTRVSYSVTENVENPKELRHDLAREVLKYFGTEGVEITSVSDIPGEGTGLGSSSAFAVGLTKAVTVYTTADITLAPSALAELAYYVEKNLCAHPVGKQDHYAAAHGGLRFYQFNSNEIVDVESLGDNAVLKGLENHLMLFYTGKTRRANQILNEQERNLLTDTRIGIHLRNLAIELRDQLRRGNFLSLGDILARNWAWKKQLAGEISNDWIDDLYNRAVDAGAIGGKLLGAGGGGFLLFAVHQTRQDDVECALRPEGVQRVPFRIECEGSKVIYDSEKDAIRR